LETTQISRRDHKLEFWLVALFIGKSILKLYTKMQI